MNLEEFLKFDIEKHFGLTVGEAYREKDRILATGKFVRSGRPFQSSEIKDNHNKNSENVQQQLERLLELERMIALHWIRDEHLKKYTGKINLSDLGNVCPKPCEKCNGIVYHYNDLLSAGSEWADVDWRLCLGCLSASYNNRLVLYGYEDDWERNPD